MSGVPPGAAKHVKRQVCMPAIDFFIPGIRGDEYTGSRKTGTLCIESLSSLFRRCRRLRSMKASASCLHIGRGAPFCSTTGDGECRKSKATQAC